MAALSHSSKLFLFLILAAAAFGQVSGSPGVTGGASGGAPTGAAGGDLSSNYPNPTVAKVNGNTPGGTCTNQVTISINSSAVPSCTTITSAFVDTTVCSNASCTQTAALASGLTGSPAIQVSTVTASTNVDIRASLSIGAAAGHLADSATAPTVSSGFGTSPTIPSNNGTTAFTINVGTGGTATGGVVGLPAATTGWSLHCDDVTTQSTNVFITKQTATSTTTATLTQYNTAGTATAWVASDILVCQARAY